MLTPHDILGSDGSIARRLERYEMRREQLDMADAVYQAFCSKKHLAVEAGTGVGKSFAYLIPAILQTAGDQNRNLDSKSVHDDADDPFYGEFPPQTRPPRSLPPSDFFGANRELQQQAFLFNEESVPRAVISTHTISLQEQIIEKDVPFLRSVLPFEFTAVLVKGRSNYVCLRRLNSVHQKQISLIVDQKQRELKRLMDWSESTPDGSRSDLNPEPDRELWNEVCCEAGNCLGKKCKLYNSCFYAKARRRIHNAQILVVNHALLFSDLAVRMQGGSILPTFNMLVFDEAHTIEPVAADHLGLSVTQGTVEYHLNRLYNERTQKGLLMERESVSQHLAVPAMQAVEECSYRSETFFQDLADWLQKRPGSNGRVRESGIVANGLSESIRSLESRLRDAIEQIEKPEERQELRAAKDRISAIKESIDLWIMQGLEDESVYWLESYGSRGKNRVEICASPIDIGSILREQLFEKIPSVVMTSATLATKKCEPTKKKNELETMSPDLESSDSFSFFKTQIGMTALDTLLLGSPFDYEKQATLVMLQNAPGPESREDVLRPFYEAMLRKYLTETGGGAFVLFTSYSLLRRTASDLTPWLAEHKMPLFTQGEGMPRSEMIRRFKASPGAVLFGTDSFWQGVDVPGDALRNVIITKLPFAVPSQPVMEAKIEAIRQRGGNPFREYQLPLAILKFKQGFGRLIRTRNDQGLVVVLDPRIHSKSYGKQFLDALPKCRIRIDR